MKGWIFHPFFSFIRSRGGGTVLPLGMAPELTCGCWHALQSWSGAGGVEPFYPLGMAPGLTNGLLTYSQALGAGTLQFQQERIRDDGMRRGEIVSVSLSTWRMS